MDRQSLSKEVSFEQEIAQTETRDESLGQFTPARISLSRTGNSLMTRHTLAFALDHARARDAVHANLSVPTLLNDLHALGLEAVTLTSAASDRATYVRRPDLGRSLNASARAVLSSGCQTGKLPRLTIIVADGLSALAADRNALPVIAALLPLVRMDWELTPIMIAEQARVALGDEIGETLGAQITVMLIGERPGLSAADSLGAYITWDPRIGRTNAERNCISNIRNQGLSPDTAADQIASLMRQAKLAGLTGTALKCPTGQPLLENLREGR